MLDIRFLRENPDIVRDNIKKKFQDEKLPLVDEVIVLYDQKRELQQEEENLRAQRNSISKQIGVFMAQGKREEAEEAKKSVSAFAGRLDELTEKGRELDDKILKIMYTIPNIIDHMRSFIGSLSGTNQSAGTVTSLPKNTFGTTVITSPK